MATASSDSSSPTAQINIPQTTINLSKLGYFLDGWAELIENMGDKTEEVQKNVFQSLKERKMPGIHSDQQTGYVSLVLPERRTYTISKTSPGATTTIYIGNHGKDLYVSWRTFIAPVLNMQVLAAMFGIALILGLLTGGIDRTGGGLFGGPLRLTFSFFGWVLYTIFWAIFEAIVVAFAGRLLKGGFLNYFFIEPNIFDADDITAMGLSVHKSLLRALDITGIDISKLRLKQNFKGGRRDDTV